ncbi:carboxypeptidase regulatory-like domain-containing protein [Rubrivirga sp. S365]|uniref:Carboxypeptidase regulatory-like domain-containing protein n=1 Tax=Rubrivirga litoralis TaxID=3075598 RepID=A0ABU3BMB7_9BACT|nr:MULTISPECIES: carboxypeptidase regulatory-like domain-containing protein [unclassified Rubrivirga]MDT0630403.1 carboxypeptidase regulatory-like domain-containing protein [Rubrivirga sp. F394]MDT7855914.1 carboxypeptidase regulatory-like domain-containing protein [Rubrivirga sp. S365]
MRVLPALALFLILAAPAAAQSDGSAPPAPGVVAGGTVEGVVTNAETGQPVAGAGVVIPALGIGAMTDREGRYAIADVPPGEHAVRAGAFTYHMTDYAVTVAEGGAVRLDAPLAPGAGAGCAAVHPGDHGEADTAP